MGKAFKRDRSTKATAGSDPPRPSENFMVGKHLERRVGGLQNESAGKRSHDYMGSRRNLVGTSKDLLEPVTLTLVVSEHESAAAGGRNCAERGAQLFHIPLDVGGRRAG